MQALSVRHRSTSQTSAEGMPLRIAVVMNMIAPTTVELFRCLSGRRDVDLLAVYETESEPGRRWPVPDLDFPHIVLESRTIDLRRVASDAFVHVPYRPLKVLSGFRPDVVIAAGAGIWSSPTNVASLAARRRHGWAFVPVWGSFARHDRSLIGRSLDPWINWFLRCSDACAAYGTLAAADAVRRGANPDRVVVTPHIASSDFVPSSAERSSSLQFRFLFVGQLLERKGVDVLLEAFSRVNGARLDIAGDGPLAARVEAAAETNPNLTVHGHLDSAAIRELYQECDALLLPSRYEVWGLVVNEALAAGLPVVVTDQVGAGADLVKDGLNGYVVRSGSAEGLAEAMRAVASWSPERFARARALSRTLLASWNVEAAAGAYRRVSEIAVAHRRLVRES